MSGTKTEKETQRGSSSSGSSGSSSSSSTQKPLHFRYACSGMQGRRASMEDAFICQLLPLPQHALFCVLDGHGGSEASEFAKGELVPLFCNTQSWQSYCQKVAPFLSSKEKCNSSTNILTNKQLKELTSLLGKALEQAFVELDRAFYLQQYDGEMLISSAGSTAVAVLLTPFSIVCGNIGDSRAVLARSSTSSPTSITAHPLTEDHTPNLEQEKQRILNLGGTVEMGRVDGELAVSRAFGDFELKDVSSLMADEYDATDPDDVDQLQKRAQLQKVSAYPEVRVQERNDTNDRFLVLACDGIWDVASNEDVVEWIVNMFQQGQDDLGIVCEQVLDICLGQGSQDNMTILVVILEGGQKLIAKGSTGSASSSR